MHDVLLVQWFEALERRHLEKLSFQEVRKAVQALSSLYVERRERIESGTAFGSAGKRAALALYFGPLHFLLVREIVRALGANIPGNTAILDLGCGTGAAGAAWALESESHPRVLGVDRNGWALQECKWNYERLGIRGTTRSADISTLRIPPDTAVIAALSINELNPESREQTYQEFTRVARKGSSVLIIEPIARRVTSWWEEWADKLKSLGVRNDEWRFRVDLPERLALMDKAAGLDHRELTGRSLWLPGSA
jgi:SAM-dependent methyltransferase